jgi:hypothetical protein
MARALAITRTEHTAADLREAAAKSSDSAQVHQLLAIALVLDGDARTDAAQRGGMDRPYWTGCIATTRRGSMA